MRQKMETEDAYSTANQLWNTGQQKHNCWSPVGSTKGRIEYSLISSAEGAEHSAAKFTLGVHLSAESFRVKVLVIWMFHK